MFTWYSAILFTFAFPVCLSYSLLPSYIVPCSRSDPNFNDCALKNGREAIPYIVKGDQKYHIPSFEPLKVKHSNLESSPTIKLFGNDIEITGLNEMQLNDINWDIENQSIELTVFCPDMEVVGTYHVEGRILIMTMRGSGLMNISHIDNTIKIFVKYNLVTRKDKEYMEIEDFNVDMKIRDNHFHFENLLNNREISHQVNILLNENSNVLMEDLLPAVNRIVETVARSIFEPIMDKIPYDNIVKP